MDGVDASVGVGFRAAVGLGGAVVDGVDGTDGRDGKDGMHGTDEGALVEV
jgi:hypothetical protein